MNSWTTVLILAAVVTGGSAQTRIENDVRELLRKALAVYMGANFNP